MLRFTFRKKKKKGYSVRARQVAKMGLWQFVGRAMEAGWGDPERVFI